MSQSKMGENEIVEHIRDEDDKNGDNSEINDDEGSIKRSCIWNHFSEKKIDQSIAICKYCKKVLSGSTKGGTNYLKCHLETVCKKYQKNSVNQILIVVSSKDPMKSFKLNQEDSRKFLARLIISAELRFHRPSSTADDDHCSRISLCPFRPGR